MARFKSLSHKKNTGFRQYSKRPSKSRERANLQSTNPSNLPINKTSNLDSDNFPTSDSPNQKTNNIFYAIHSFRSTDKAYTDLTGRFPVQSSWGSQYILVCYHYDANAILAQPLKSRSAPTHIHRRNAAERAIQTFKNHFLAGLASCNPKFPLREWDRLIPQAVITLNLLRNARLNPKLSSYSFLFGPYDFKKYPLMPPGTEVVVHSKPSNQESFFPHDIPLPKVSTEDYLRQASSDIINLLTNPIAHLPYNHSNS